MEGAYGELKAKPLPPQVAPHLHPELVQIAMRALAKDKNKRYQHAADFNHELNLYLNRMHPEFSSRNVSSLMKEYFGGEIANERVRHIDFSKKYKKERKLKSQDEDKTLVIPEAQWAELMPFLKKESTNILRQQAVRKTQPNLFQKIFFITKTLASLAFIALVYFFLLSNKEIVLQLTPKPYQQYVLQLFAPFSNIGSH